MQLKLMHPDFPAAAVTQEEYEAAKEWVIKTEVLEEAFIDDVSVTFGNNEPIKGKDAVKKLFKWQFSALKSFDHSVEFILVLKEGIIVQSKTTYNYTDGESTTVKAVGMYAKTPDSTKGYRVPPVW
ncbi:hypothetical protein DFP72DRAFT_1060206 [Ephemerocybe angulata]|uniref:Nuclear transport factor 2 family protein n=1 Tax=Ephemerocybe angulata TaxID=980116 RepID=A0A8H6MC49_9AGAR|nr:hypothetical protein DFP72DRAFT_1060206 [Tulosesus angulatus]